METHSVQLKKLCSLLWTKESNICSVTLGTNPRFCVQPIPAHPAQLGSNNRSLREFSLVLPLTPAQTAERCCQLCFHGCIVYLLNSPETSLRTESDHWYFCRVPTLTYMVPWTSWRNHYWLVVKRPISEGWQSWTQSPNPLCSSCVTLGKLLPSHTFIPSSGKRARKEYPLHRVILN